MRINLNNPTYYTHKEYTSYFYEKDMDVINKVTNYMLNLLYHLDNTNKNGNNLGQKDKNENGGDNNDNEYIIKNYNEKEKNLKEFEENVEVSDNKEDDDDVLKTDIFYPQKNIKKLGKRNYNDMIGEKNELKIFKEKLLFNSKLKNNKNKINYRVNLIIK